MLKLPTVADIRSEFIEKLLFEEYTLDKTGCKLIELVGTSFIANAPAIFGKPNEDYIKREIEWYKSMSLEVDKIPGVTPKIWKDVASTNGEINSNYGYLVFSDDNAQQYNNVFKALASDQDTRRAIMIYTRPSMQSEYCRDGMSDFICTNTVQYFIRDNTLRAIVNMRSNDVVFGYRNDWAWQKHVLEQLCTDLRTNAGYENLEPGDIIWQTGSLHVYERHFNLIK